MSKEAPHQNPSSAAEKTLSREDWISRNRRALVLTLGIVLGCGGKPAPALISTNVPTVQEKKEPVASAETAQKMVEELMEDFDEMPSPCDLRKDTFLANSSEFNILMTV